MRDFKDLKIAVAGTGYVGLSIATLLAQHHKVTAVDIIPEKVELINNKKSPIQDEYIEKYLAEKELDLTATLDAKEAYSDAAGNHIIIEELTEAESVKIRIYDNEQKTVSMDEQKITCPDKECNIHHVLTFRHDEDIPYYIVQIENESTVKNVEVDSQYFK